MDVDVSSDSELVTEDMEVSAWCEGGALFSSSTVRGLGLVLLGMPLGCGGERVLAALLTGRHRKGDDVMGRSSASDEDDGGVSKCKDNVGAIGEPCDEDTRADLDRNPAWNRLGLPRFRLESSGTGSGMDEGLELNRELDNGELLLEGRTGRAVASLSGVEMVASAAGEGANFCGVFSKSARVPSSVSSSRHRTSVGMATSSLA
jgi:hypothetical protein